LHSQLFKCQGIDYIIYFVFRKPTFAVALMLVSYAHHSLSDSGEPHKHINMLTSFAIKLLMSNFYRAEHQNEMK